MKTCSIFFSRNSCFLISMSSVSLNFWMASPVVGAFSPFLPLPNTLPKKLMMSISVTTFRNPTEVEYKTLMAKTSMSHSLSETLYQAFFLTRLSHFINVNNVTAQVSNSSISTDIYFFFKVRHDHQGHGEWRLESHFTSHVKTCQPETEPEFLPDPGVVVAS